MKDLIKMNKAIFQTRHNPKMTKNLAGGNAYDLSAQAALAQYAVTCTFNNSFYASAEDHIRVLNGLVEKCSPEFIAKVAVYSRTQGNMKDMPAYLLSYLFSKRQSDLVRVIFSRVINNSKMLCNFVQFVRSGVHGRKSFGTLGRRLIRKWIVSRQPEQLFRDSIGHSSPSLADIIRMTHPKAVSIQQNNMFKYLLGMEYDLELLPDLVKRFELVKNSNNAAVNGLDFRLLSNISLTPNQWNDIALSMSWDTLRRNLNTLWRNNVFANANTTKLLANKLQDAELVKLSNAFPYQLLTTYQNTTCVPEQIKTALKQAVEHATANVPNLGRVAVCIDVSGSMSHPITGVRAGSTSVTRCTDVAGLIGSCLLRSSDADIVTFDTRVAERHVSKFDSVLDNAAKLVSGRGNTDCSSAIKHLIDNNWTGDVVFMISDNMSWKDYQNGSESELRKSLRTLKKVNPNLKFILLDITPNTTAQVPDDKDVLLIGGFSDSVFTVVKSFVDGNGKFVDIINGVSL